MSLLFTIALIAIAYLISAFIDNLSGIGHILTALPMWLTGLIGLGLLSWFVSDP